MIGVIRKMGSERRPQSPPPLGESRADARRNARRYGRDEVSIRSRVLLRRATSADIAELVELAAASRRLHHPWVDPPATTEALEAWVARRPDRAAGFVACRREDAAIVGVFSLSEIVRGPFRSAYSSYWAHARYAGRGYMSEGLRLLLREAFGPLKLHRIEANIQPGNAASIALVRRAGFRLEGLSPRYLKINGRWRDHERWAITRDDPRPG
jgi:[ribosomal protein S5]-alanine N-acetyltransferase